MAVGALDTLGIMGQTASLIFPSRKQAGGTLRIMGQTALRGNKPHPVPYCPPSPFLNQTLFNSFFASLKPLIFQSGSIQCNLLSLRPKRHQQLSDRRSPHL